MTSMVIQGGGIWWYRVGAFGSCSIFASGLPKRSDSGRDVHDPRRALEHEGLLLRLVELVALPQPVQLLRVRDHAALLQRDVAVDGAEPVAEAGAVRVQVGEL